MVVNVGREIKESKSWFCNTGSVIIWFLIDCLMGQMKHGSRPDCNNRAIKLRKRTLSVDFGAPNGQSCVSCNCCFCFVLFFLLWPRQEKKKKTQNVYSHHTFKFSRSYFSISVNTITSFKNTLYLSLTVPPLIDTLVLHNLKWTCSEKISHATCTAFLRSALTSKCYTSSGWWHMFWVSVTLILCETGLVWWVRSKAMENTQGCRGTRVRGAWKAEVCEQPFISRIVTLYTRRSAFIPSPYQTSDTKLKANSSFPHYPLPPLQDTVH